MASFNCCIIVILSSGGEELPYSIDKELPYGIDEEQMVRDIPAETEDNPPVVDNLADIVQDQVEQLKLEKKSNIGQY